jgi:probable HAF family extracellular repeat protein
MPAAAWRPISLGAIVFLLSCGPEPTESSPAEVGISAAVTVAAYKAVNLGTLGGSSSTAYAISPGGAVVGSSLRKDGTEHAFLWQNGVKRDLGALPGDCCSVAYGINKDGVVVGQSSTSTGLTHAFVWKNGVMTQLAGGCCSEATAINTVGQIVGRGAFAFRYQNGVFTNVDAGSGVRLSQPSGINPQGQVTGEGVNAAGYQRAILWSNGVTTNLGTLGGNFSTAHDINGSTEVVGISTMSNGKYQAFIWRNGKMSNLGVPGVLATANGINGDHVVVGQRETSTAFKAFIWRAGVTSDLPSLGGKYSSANAINATGRIVGESRTGTSGPFATLWIPK